MKQIKIKFVGIDAFNRPIFKSELGSYYGACDILFSGDATEGEVLAKVKPEDITYFGNSFGCEPMGCRANVEIVKNEVTK